MIFLICVFVSVCVFCFLFFWKVLRSVCCILIVNFPAGMICTIEFRWKRRRKRWSSDWNWNDDGDRKRWLTRETRNNGMCMWGRTMKRKEEDFPYWNHEYFQLSTLFNDVWWKVSWNTLHLRPLSFFLILYFLFCIKWFGYYSKYLFNNWRWLHGSVLNNNFDKSIRSIVSHTRVLALRESPRLKEENQFSI